jgi:hypothetical protein
MKNGGSRWMVLLLVASVIAGCGKEGNPERGMDERDALRVTTDTARNRRWVLGLDDVRVYDTAKKRLIRRIELPNWSVARFVCNPDMVLDGLGSAYISSNVQAKLWRIDAESFEVKEHEISLLGRERWDVGFGALAFAADGNLIALTSLAGSLWKIDVAKASGHIIEQNNRYLNVCAVPAQFLKDFERSQKP